MKKCHGWFGFDFDSLPPVDARDEDDTTDNSVKEGRKSNEEAPKSQPVDTVKEIRDRRKKWRKRSPRKLKNVGTYPAKYEYLMGLPVNYYDTDSKSRFGYIYKIVGDKVSIVSGWDLKSHVVVDKERIAGLYDRKTKEITAIQW